MTVWPRQHAHFAGLPGGWQSCPWLLPLVSPASRLFHRRPSAIHTLPAALYRCSLSAVHFLAVP